MMDLATLRSVNNQAMRRSRSEGRVPVILWPDGEERPSPEAVMNGRGIPYIGERKVAGWKATGDPLFVDKSGWGSENEPAMTIRQFLNSIEQGIGYGVIEEGQFKVYVQKYKRTARRG